MRARPSLAAALCAVAGALGFAFACKSTTENTCGSGTPPSLVGTYALESLTLGVGTPLTSPQETGTLRFHATTYGVDLAGALAQSDTGTYAITGASCISQNSAVTAPFTGSFTLVGSTLSIAGSQGGQAVASVWTKTS